MGITTYSNQYRWLLGSILKIYNNLEKWGDVSEAKVLLVLAEDTGSGPSILMGSHNNPKESDTHFWPLLALHTCGTDIYADETPISKIK